MKHLTRYIIDGKVVAEKKYKFAPYAEFRRKDYDFISVIFKKRTLAIIPLYYAIGIAFIMDILFITFITYRSLSPYFFTLIILIMVILNIGIFFFAILLSIYKLGANFEFIFDRRANIFMKKKLSNEENQNIIYQYTLTEISHIEIRSIINKYARDHIINFRLHSGKRIKFFHIAHNNHEQIWNYIQILCDFLKIDYIAKTRKAKKYFYRDDRYDSLYKIFHNQRLI